MSFGSGGFGAVPFGSGELSADFGAVVNLGAYLAVPYSGPTGGCGSVLDPYVWSVSSDCDKCPPFVQLIELVGGELRFYLDRQERCGCSYQLTDGANAFSFAGACPETESVTDDPEDDIYLRDIANPAHSRDLLGGELATFQRSESGDLENQGGIASLRKRVIRRCTVIAGELFSSPGYGSVLSVKKLARTDLLMVAQSKMTAQILREPEARGCSVKISRIAGHPDVVWVSVVVNTGAGDVPFGFEVGR